MTTRRHPLVRARLAWLLSGVMLAVAEGDWEAAGKDAAAALELLQRVAAASRRKAHQAGDATTVNRRAPLRTPT